MHFCHVQIQLPWSLLFICLWEVWICELCYKLAAWHTKCLNVCLYQASQSLLLFFTQIFLREVETFHAGIYYQAARAVSLGRFTKMQVGYIRNTARKSLPSPAKYYFESKISWNFKLEFQIGISTIVFDFYKVCRCPILNSFTITCSLLASIGQMNSWLQTSCINIHI